MKNTIRLVIILCCSVFLFGCPYTSSVPISEKSLPVDKRILGNWENKSQPYEEYTVSQENNEYIVLVHDSKENTDKKYSFYISMVKNTKFINLVDIQENPNEYILFKMDVKANTITLTEIPDSIKEKFSSSEALKSFIEKNINDSKFFQGADVTVLTRKFD